MIICRSEEKGQILDRESKWLGTVTESEGWWFLIEVELSIKVNFLKIKIVHFSWSRTFLYIGVLYGDQGGFWISFWVTLSKSRCFLILGETFEALIFQDHGHTFYFQQ